ncbi:MAG TPA: tRNA (adenosine(37)-N6)-dimethylallyltransferase MiaA [Bacteroidales bacterium]|jgi:tRNA dimethylallyltransferase|nr:tRNA (adenosine(37)-N6)-dimethylallyltransferase MiaA [Bacteroidales bacterium]
MESIIYNLVVVLGPTASGKTSFAAHLAHSLNGEVISADSRQIYRRMNIGTGKDYKDYVVNGNSIPVHLTDIAEPGYKYSVYEYQRDFYRVFNDITARVKFPVLCGGSGMYIDAATRNYRLIEVPVNEKLRRDLRDKSLEELASMLAKMKDLHNKTDTDTVEHALRAIEIQKYYDEHKDSLPEIPVINPVYIGILFDRKLERERITVRLKNRLKEGMVEEVKQLLESGVPAESLSYYGLEYRYVTSYLTGKLDYETMVSQLNTAIHQFAKRQRTWFRKMEREGCLIHWLDGESPMKEKIDRALKILRTS